MDLPQRIVVGSDGSPTAARAVAVGAALALALDAPLVVVTVWGAADDRRRSATTGDRPWQGEQAWAEQVAADAAGVARAAGVPEVTTAAPQGAPAPTLQDLTSRVPRSLLVVGSVGLDSASDRRLGSIPHHLAHRAPGDVLLVRPGTDPAPDWPEVVLTTDGSATSEHAARTGLALARLLAARPVLVSVGPDLEDVAALLEEVADRIDDGGPLALEPVADGDISGGLAAAVADRGLLVLGNRRMRGIGRLLGSVPDDLLHRLPSDLLLVNTSG